MKLMVARHSASQNRFEPQRAQKPRRASGDERYQARLSDPVIESFSRLAALAATKCRLERRHWEQRPAHLVAHGTAETTSAVPRWFLLGHA